MLGKEVKRTPVLAYGKEASSVSNPERHGRPADPTRDFFPHPTLKSEYEEVLERLQQEMQQVAHHQTLLEQAEHVAKYGYSRKLTDFGAGPTKWGGWGRVAPIGNADYFAQTCRGYEPIEVFHQFRNYQHPGFIKHVEQLPGHEEFILGLEGELNPHKCSPLQHFIYDNVSSKEYASVVTGLRNSLIVAKARVAQREVVRQEQILQAHGFNRVGLDQLARYNARKVLIYDCNAQQSQFMHSVSSHFNELGEFYPTVPKNQTELLKVVDLSYSFGVAASEANRQQRMQSAGHLLGAARNFLAFGKGVLKSGGKFACGLYQAVCHPIDSTCSAADCLANASICIAKAANSGVRLAALQQNLNLPEVDQVLVRQQLNQEEQRWRRKKSQAYLVYQAVEQAYQDASQEEVCEKAGELLTDAVLAFYGNKACFNAIGTGLKVSGVARYQPAALEALGQVRKEVYQVVGLAAKIGAGKVNQGLQIIKDHPQVLKAGQTITQGIQAGRKAIRQTNRYLKSTSKSLVDTVQQIPVGESFKKIPRACVAKTKQLIGDEAVVVDTWGNTWRSKIESNHWDIQLSEMGKKNLILLNEAAAARGTITVAEIERLAEGSRRFIEIPMCSKTKAIEQEVLALIKSKSAKMEAEGVTIGQCLGAKNDLGKISHLPFSLDNFEHACLPRIEAVVGRNKVVKYKLTGLHWDEGRRFEKLGFLKMENVQELVGGMYSADIWVYKGYKESKTFFPSHWDFDMLLSKIKEACFNAESFATSKWGGSIHIVGKIEEGFYINVKLSSTGKILTVYPSKVNCLKVII